MQKLGWVEGRNLQIAYRYASGQSDRLSAVIDEAINDKPNLIIVSGSAAVAALRATNFSAPALAVTSDGWRGSLARPEGNLSGISLQFEDVAAKWAELLVLAFPHVRRIAIVVDTSPSNQRQFEVAAGAVTSMQRVATHYPIESPTTLALQVKRAKEDGADALIFASSPIFTANAEGIVDAVRNVKLPAIFESRVIVQRGGLMSYGANLNEVFRRLAWYADKVLRGTKPTDLPVEQPTSFELAINMRAARDIGASIPDVVLARAQEVLE